MKDDTLDTVATIYEETSKPQEVQPMNQADYLRERTFSFLTKSMQEMEDYKTVIKNGLANLNERILHNELDADDVLKVINSLSSQVTGRTAVLLDPFKPSNQTPSPLLPPAPSPRVEETDIEKGMKNLSSNDLQLLDKFIRVIEQRDGK
jgi:hypothetical protein